MVVKGLQGISLRVRAELVRANAQQAISLLEGVLITERLYHAESTSRAPRQIVENTFQQDESLCLFDFRSGLSVHAMNFFVPVYFLIDPECLGFRYSSCPVDLVRRPNFFSLPVRVSQATRSRAPPIETGKRLHHSRHDVLPPLSGVTEPLELRFLVEANADELSPKLGHCARFTCNTAGEAVSELCYNETKLIGSPSVLQVCRSLFASIHVGSILIIIQQSS